MTAVRPGRPAQQRWNRRRLAAVVLAPWLLSACGTGRVDRALVDPSLHASLDGRSPFLKAHLRDGGLYVLERWHVDADARTVHGDGALLDAARDTVSTGAFAVSVDSVAVFETNVPTASGSIAFMTVVTGISLAVTGYCAANPKACFGSCPTFHVPGGSGAPVAEGFSSSIAPSLEKSDVDALFGLPAGSRDFRLEMRNEALETHVVRHVDLLAVPRDPGTRVIKEAGDRGFREIRSLSAPERAIAEEGAIGRPLAALDGDERVSATDGRDLAGRETIELEFDSPGTGPLGLVIGARQSLLSTYLFYQTLAYMGGDAGHWLAELERRDGARPDGVHRELGGIEVEVRDATGAWVPAGSCNETGPLATDVHLVALPDGARDRVRVRLRLTRGHWRLDWVALAELGKRVEPVRLHPVAVSAGGEEDPAALAALLDPERFLTTMPGDAYTIEWRLPDDPDRFELFLESRGYYLEWMRREWMEEEDPGRLARMLFTPRDALRELAPEFKRREADMEAAFWSSRVARP